MKYQFLWIGQTRTRPCLELERLYLERIRRWVPAQVSVVAEMKKRDRHAMASQLGRERELIEKKLAPGGQLAILHEEGEQFSSSEFAEKLNFLMSSPVSEVTFLVGGHLGIPEGIFGRADWRISLGRQTLPHELARVVLLEQVYRGLSILRGLPYHR